MISDERLEELIGQLTRIPYLVHRDGDNSDGLSWRTAYRTLTDLEAAHPLVPGQIVWLGGTA
jgi:hypothetical protein